MHDSLHQQALGIDQDVSFLALDLLAGIIARLIEPARPSNLKLHLLAQTLTEPFLRPLDAVKK
jgi:hypothetical protein